MAVVRLYNIFVGPRIMHGNVCVVEAIDQLAARLTLINSPVSTRNSKLNQILNYDTDCICHMTIVKCIFCYYKSQMNDQNCQNINTYLYNYFIEIDIVEYLGRQCIGSVCIINVYLTILTDTNPYVSKIYWFDIHRDFGLPTTYYLHYQ